MPTDVRRGVTKDALPGLVAEARREVARYWRRYPETIAFLEDHFPENWDYIQRCRLHYRTYEFCERPGEWKIQPRACGRVPYCLLCTKKRDSRRAMETLDRFNLVTPAGQKPRFVHIVMTAPLFKEGDGWGWKACKDIVKFGQVTKAVLYEIYGDGIGGVMSYHDFGERAFAKIHPHMDLTLNGWQLDGGATKKLGRVQLEDGGRARIDEITSRRASVFDIAATPSNIHFSNAAEGTRQYFKVLRYQMRELVDLGKVAYRRGTDRVGWRDYKSAAIQWMTVNEFKEGYREHVLRMKGDGDRKVDQHRPFGHMSRNQHAAVSRLVGGQAIPHGANCGCNSCGDWEEREYDLDGAGGPEYIDPGP